MRTRSAALVSLALALAALPARPEPVTGQVPQRVFVGGVAGLVRSRQVADGGETSDPRTGFLAGAWVEVATSVTFLQVLAEAAYVRRGGRVAVGGPANLLGEVESDWFAATVAPVVRLAVGPASVFAYGGPTLEVPARTRTVAQLQNRYASPSEQALAVTAGVGVGVRRGRWEARGEVRHVEGLTSVYGVHDGGVRHRSTEMVVRVGRARGGRGGRGAGSGEV